MNSGPLEVLIVEDNPGDALLISELLEDMGLPLHIIIAKDGQIALDMLNKDDGNSNAPAPDFVILDLNLPRVKGFEVLAYMKKTTSLHSVPVVVMTGSLKKDDEVKARSMGAADYCIKPATPEEMEKSTMCLRGHLESLHSKGKSNGSGPSANSKLDLFLVDVEDQRVPPPCSERFVMDVSNTWHWSMWK